jgi:hypothetical protein
MPLAILGNISVENPDPNTYFIAIVWPVYIVLASAKLEDEF